MMVGKVFCMSVDGSSGRSIAYREGKSKSRVSLPIRVNQCLFHDEVVQWNPPATGWQTDHWECCRIWGSALKSAAGR